MAVFTIAGHSGVHWFDNAHKQLLDFNACSGRLLDFDTISFLSILMFEIGCLYLVQMSGGYSGLLHLHSVAPLKVNPKS